MKVCIVGASGKLGRYMTQHSLDRGYEVVGVCRGESVRKLDAYKERITVILGKTNDREVIEKAVAGCDGVLTVLAPWGIQQYLEWNRSGSARPREPGRAADLLLRMAHHARRPGRLLAEVHPARKRRQLARPGHSLRRARRPGGGVPADLASDTRWTVVRGSGLEEGPSQGLPVWSRHVGDAILESNLTRRIDFALFMVAALENDELIHEAPAIVGCRTPSALAHAALKTTTR